MAGLQTQTLLSAISHVFAFNVHVASQLRLIRAHRCAEAGVCCQLCPTSTNSELCVVLVACQAKEQSDHAQLSGTQWVHHVGQCRVEVSAYDASPLLFWCTSGHHTCIDC